MGDRCHVGLYILTEQADEAEKCFGGNANEGPNTDSTDLSYWGFEDVNYGDLWFLWKLKDQGIAYTVSIAGGDSYGPSNEYLRFTSEGEAIVWDLTEGESENISVALLRTVLDDPVSSIDDVRAYVSKHVEELTPLPWDNQVQYGKVYRTLQLISK